MLQHTSQLITSQHKETIMTDNRIRLLSEDVYNYVFQMLDSEPDIDGNEAGRVANKLQRLFESTLSDESTPDRIRASIRRVAKEFRSDGK